MVSLINKEYHKVMEDSNEDDREDVEDKEIDTEENEKD